MIMSPYHGTSWWLPVEGLKAASLMSLIAFPALPFGNQVIESSKITHNSLLFRLGWQSWDQGLDPPQLHQGIKELGRQSLIHFLSSALKL